VLLLEHAGATKSALPVMSETSIVCTTYVGIRLAVMVTLPIRPQMKRKGVPVNPLDVDVTTM
jgi:hypothetical protein